jgi:membrane-associated protease RseP (regulator of RpoE activity)
MSFADWNAVIPPAPLWSVLGNDWRQVYVDAPVRVRTTPNTLLWQTQYQYSILPSPAKPSILVNTEGAFVGFALDSGLVTNGWLMDYQIGTLLDHGIIGYRAVPWRGFFVSQRVGDNASADQHGFYVTTGVPKSGTGVQIGDVVKSINGRPIDEINAARTILTAPDEFDATIIRNGVEMKVRVSKTVVNP